VEERRTSPVELLWDLVFVFAVTQVTTLLSHDLSWTGFGHGMLVLGLVWWAWSAYVWAANAEQEESRVLRGVLLLGMVFIFIAGVALPHAFDDRATLFACTYACVRLLHLALYAHASRSAAPRGRRSPGSPRRWRSAWRCSSPARCSMKPYACGSGRWRWRSTTRVPRG
jgi:low temperature requirement protein LtrA